MAGASPQRGSRQSNSNSNIFALLSLKVLLLAFFILLNSLASFEEERRSAVVESVREAFQGLVPAVRSISDSPAALDLLDGGEDIADSLKQLFGSDLPLVELPESSGARVLQMDIAVDEFFEEGGNALRPDGAETLRLVAAVLADPRFARQEARVDVLYGLSGHTSGLDGNRTALLRAATLVRSLEHEGMAPLRLSAGLLPALPGKVRLHFTVEAQPAPAAGEEG
jgi:hypothetical protein